MFRRLIPQENYHSDFKSSNEDPDDYDQCNNYLSRRSEPRLRELTKVNLKSPDEDADDNFCDKKNIFLSTARLRESTEPVVYNSAVATKQGAPS